MRGEFADIAGFGLRQTSAAQCLSRYRKNPLRMKWHSNNLSDALFDRRGGFTGKLLADDRIRQHVKRLEFSLSQRAVTVTGDQSLHHSIYFGQVSFRFTDRLLD
jgi:hypothetical protein